MSNWAQLSDAVKPSDWNSSTYSQKIMWRGRNPNALIDYSNLVDKHKVKKVVQPFFKVAKPYLVVEQLENIDSNILPSTYVMKATHGWNMSLLVVDGIVRGENRNQEKAGKLADTKYLKQVANSWFQSEQELLRRQRERQYLSVKPRILFEQFLQPVDYELQLFLFNGQCQLTMVLYRQFYHKESTHRLYDGNWQLLNPGSEADASRYDWLEEPTPRPPRSLMHSLEHLCRSMDHVRADFYVSSGNYYFSEFSFTHNAGNPGLIGIYDAYLGNFWVG